MGTIRWDDGCRANGRRIRDCHLSWCDRPSSRLSSELAVSVASSCHLVQAQNGNLQTIEELTIGQFESVELSIALTLTITITWCPVSLEVSSPTTTSRAAQSRSQSGAEQTIR